MGARQARGGQRVEDAGGWGGITLAHNVRSPEEVDAVLDQARAAGGRVGRAGAETSWGGYSGIFVDPDGHPWEVAHNPGWTLAEDGTVDRWTIAARSAATRLRRIGRSGAGQ